MLKKYCKDCDWSRDNYVAGYTEPTLICINEDFKEAVAPYDSRPYVTIYVENFRCKYFKIIDK